MISWIKEHKAALFQVIGYLTIAVVMLTMFIYLTFPWEKLSRYVEVRIEEATSSSIEVGKSEVKFPFKMIWTEVRFRSVEERRPVRVDIDRLSMEWTLARLLQRRLELLWAVRMAEGEGHGRIQAQPTGQGMQYRITGDTNGIQLARLVEYFTPNAYGIEGSVRVSQLRHDWVGEDFLKGTGEANLEISDSRIGTLDVSFNRISARLSMKSGVAHLEDVSAQGPVLDLAGSGNVLLRPVLPNSLINFSSRATLRDPGGPLSLLFGSSRGGAGASELTLRGTIRQPKLFLNGVHVWTMT
jgi:type II secretion system protein N